MKQRIQTTKRLGEVLNTVTCDLHSKDLSRLRGLEVAWSDLVPAELVHCVRPIRVKHDHLEVEIDPPMSITVKNFVIHTLPSSLEHTGINTVGYRVAGGLLQNAEPKATMVSSKAEAQTATITDPGLRMAMAQLLSAVQDRKG